MVEPMNMEITDDEAALYDRQIRLWGLESQKRLRAAQVLIVGLGGLGAEVTKNVTLAGVKSVVLLDDKNVSEDDLCCQFFITKDDIDKNRAECSVSQAQQLNPMVAVSADSDSISSKDDDFFHRFDVVILTNCSKEEMLKLNKICRNHNVKFFAGGVFGYFGFFFTDLYEHNFCEEIQIQCSLTMEDGTTKQTKETKTVQKKINFVSLKTALEHDWESEKNSQHLKRLSSSYFILQCLLNFRGLHKRNPSRLKWSQDSSELLRFRDELLDKMGVSKDRLDDKFASSVYAELSPICAIVGGVMAQEVIKAVSCKNAPLNNFFLYNALEDSGLVENIGN